MEYVDAETTKAFFGERKVDLELFVELLHLIFGHQLQRRLPDHLRRHFETVDRNNLAFDLDLGRREWGKKKVRSLFFNHQFE